MERARTMKALLVALCLLVGSNGSMLAPVPSISTSKLHKFDRGSPVNREAAIHSVALKLRGGALEDYCEKSWEWMAELGAPAALVGGAALASFFELRDRLAPDEADTHVIRFAKSTVMLLLLGSFASEIACVYVNTIAGDQLMANGDAPISTATGTLDHGWGAGVGRTDCMASSVMGMMYREMEFEYLASRVGFFQGILMWISALSIELWLCGASVDVSDPKAAPGKAAIARRRLNFATSACICSLALWMLAFYNWHLPFYSNYAHMVARLAKLSWLRYIWRPGPPRYTAIAALVPLAVSVYFASTAVFVV